MQSKQKPHMKRHSLSIVIATMTGFALVPAASAQTVDGSILYTPNVDLTSLSQNGFVGYVGGVFLTSYNYFPEVNYLGFADPTGAPLANSHVVSLWDNSGGNVLLASAIVPAGNAAPLVDGYRWVQLPSTVNLTYNNYYYIVAQVGNVDTVGNPVDSWGDLIQNNSPDGTLGSSGPVANNGQITWSGQYVAAQQGYEFSRDGVYGSADDATTFNQSGANDSIYSAPNLGFNVVPTPEPSTLALLGVGTVLLFGRWSRQKN
jgi:PEP-CTERM motif